MIRLRSSTRICDSGPAIPALLSQLHVNADHIAAVQPFAYEDQATGAVDHRPLNDGDRRIQWHIEPGRRLDIGGSDDERLPRIFDLETGNIRDQLQRGLGIQVAFWNTAAQPLVDM